MKVVVDLGRAGDVETVRGKHGGLRLARPAAGVSLSEVVRRVELDVALAPCFEPLRSPCAIRPACRRFGRGAKRLLAALEGYPLADLAAEGDQIAGLLASGDAFRDDAPAYGPAPTVTARSAAKGARCGETPCAVGQMGLQ